ncbi:endonuclease, partial [Tanacetum coccineum]
MAYAGREILVIWDFENLRSGYNNPFILRTMIRSRFPGISIRFKAYANPNHITLVQRRACKKLGAPITDIPSIPGPNPNNNPNVPMVEGVGDRVMMTDMFDFAYDHPPPALVMFITGDCDFTNSLRLTGMGYTTILLCIPNQASVVLQRSATYVYDWTRIIRDRKFSGPSLPPQLLPCPERQQYFQQTVVYWDMDTTIKNNI